MTQYAFFQGEFVPIDQAKVSIMTHSFNYGTGVFGGLRGYWNDAEQQLFVFRIHDHFRRQKVRNTWTTLLSSLMPQDDEGGSDRDPLELLEAEAGSERAESAGDRVEREQVLGIIDAEIQRLPARQREAFLLRYWEDLDVAETAAAMGCSEGSVKTHCSRATHTLAQALRARGITL